MTQWNFATAQVICKLNICDERANDKFKSFSTFQKFKYIDKITSWEVEL